MKRQNTILAVVAAAALAIAGGARADSRLANISTRGYVGTGDNVMIAGAILEGDATRAIIVRALGPTLQSFGLSNVLLDPVIDIYDSNGTLVASNDDWPNDPYASEVIARGFVPSDNLEPVIFRPEIAPDKYTVIVHGYRETTGLAIVEIYDLGP